MKEPVPLFTRSGTEDVNDGKPWSEADIADLTACIENGATLTETAGFLCRSGRPVEVAEKVKELGLRFRHGGMVAIKPMKRRKR